MLAELGFIVFLLMLALGLIPDTQSLCSVVGTEGACGRDGPVRMIWPKRKSFAIVGKVVGG